MRRRERTWKRSGLPSAGRAYLRSLERHGAPEPDQLRTRVAVGDLTAVRLQLAAYLGHPAALGALGEDAPSPVAWFLPWVRGLERWGKEACARAALAAAWFCLPVYEDDHPYDDRPRRVVEAARALIRDGEDVQVREVQRAVTEATFAGSFMPLAYNVGACVLSLHVPAMTSSDTAGWAADAAWAASASGHVCERVRVAIRDDLVDWALGAA